MQELFQELFSVPFEIHEHDAVAELGVIGDDESADDDRAVVEPEFGVKACADGKRSHYLDVAAAAAEVGGLEAHRHIAAVLVDFDLDLSGAARMAAAIGFGWSGGSGLGVWRIHGSAPSTMEMGRLDGP